MVDLVTGAELFFDACQKMNPGQLAMDGELLNGIKTKYFSGDKPDYVGLSESSDLVSVIQALDRDGLVTLQLANDPPTLAKIRTFIASLGD